MVGQRRQDQPRPDQIEQQGGRTPRLEPADLGAGIGYEDQDYPRDAGDIREGQARAPDG